MKKENIYRFAFYLIGLIILAAGLILNTKSNLGVSPIISVSFSFSQIVGMSMGNATFIWYSTLVFMEIIIHLILRNPKAIPYDILQIFLSLIFTRFMNLFSIFIPDMKTDLAGTVWATVYMRIVFLLIAIILTGIGAALSLNARLIPNPGDGIVQAVSDFTGKSTGFCKNCVDISCVILSCIMGTILAHELLGVGIGTILAMIGTGRVIAVFNHFTMKPIQKLSGLSTK